MYDERLELNYLVGKSLDNIQIGKDEIYFFCGPDTFVSYHSQDCCEDVRIYDVVGDPKSILNQPIKFAETIVDSKEWPTDVKEPHYLESFTWTTYKIRTDKSELVIRWLGESNGYYSENVYFERTHRPISLGE